MHPHITQIELDTHREIQVANLEDKKKYRAIYCNSTLRCLALFNNHFACDIFTHNLFIYVFL